MSALPVRPAHELEVRPADRRWLIEDLWAAEAVGIVGGEPKCGKSFLALESSAGHARRDTARHALHRGLHPGPRPVSATSNRLHHAHRNA